MKPGDDWHYDIQHIAAQTRFLRGQLPDECLVVVYLENDKLAWPAWLTAHAPDSAVKIVSSVLERFKDSSPEVVLDSHSGGGALTFAYIQAVDTIPDFVKRIGFLDSEYRYETSVHRGKLADWLRKPGHSLCAIAYDDASALLNGKPFVSAAGGTWGKTHRMLSDLQAEFQVKRSNAADPERYTGLDGRITFLLKQNPSHEIFHTVQVERNGFIETLLSGTALDERDYRYFGERAYGKFIGD
jgi:hypothetical protein